MKKTLVLILAIAIAYKANAQVQFGVKAGYNRTTLNYSGPGINTLGPKSDFNAGAFVSIPIFNSFFLQPELQYSGQGAGYTDSIPESNYNNYLNIPVLFKYQHSSGLFAETGPQIGVLLSAQVKTDTQSFDSKSGMASTDFSWDFGLGYKIPVVNLGIDIRYNLGLTNVFTSNYYTGSANNSVFQIDLFYQFRKLL